MKKTKKYLFSILAIVMFAIFAIASTSSDNQSSSTSAEKWYVGGTLHKATVEEWKSATEKNKLATCADFAANIKKANNGSYTDL